MSWHRFARVLTETIRGAGFVPELDVDHLAKQMEFLEKAGVLTRRLVPLHSRAVPVGTMWTSDDELAWHAEIFRLFSVGVWDSLCATVFGSDCPEVCYDLYTFLPFWVRRTPMTEPEEVEAVDKMAKIDIYILEHGSSKQRKAAMRAVGIHPRTATVHPTYDE